MKKVHSFYLFDLGYKKLSLLIMKEAIRDLIRYFGEDDTREGLARTPERVEKAWAHILSGYTMQLDHIINGAVFDAPGDDMVIVKNIEIYSMCEHHLLPFFGKCAIGYIPNGKIIGVSKLARIADMYSRRLQVQERLAHEIAGAVMDALSPRGVAVIIEARHLCMMMRGVEKQNSEMTTSAMLGAFRRHPETRAEFMALISK
jgi:GTP cyclohydrolase I